MDKSITVPASQKLVNTQTGMKAKLLAPLIALASLIGDKLEKLDVVRAAKFRSDAQAFINLGSVTGIMATVLIGIVVLIILAALAPTYITAIADLVAAFANGTTNNTTADALLPVFGLLIALGGIFALVGFAFLAYRRRNA